MPLVLLGMLHLVNAPLAELWLIELELSGVGPSYAAVTLASFFVLFAATLAAVALAPQVVVAGNLAARAAPGARPTQAPPADVDDEEELDVIDPNDGREEGEVKWFNTNKGYGFITRDNGEDVFVHFRAIRGRGPRMLAEGQLVRYHVIRNDRGLQADDVSVID